MSISLLLLVPQWASLSNGHRMALLTTLEPGHNLEPQVPSGATPQSPGWRPWPSQLREGALHLQQGPEG